MRGCLGSASQRHFVSDCHPFASLRASTYLVARNDDVTTSVASAIVSPLGPVSSVGRAPAF